MESILVSQENLAVWQGMAKPNVMALGCFDGLHLGHEKVIKTAALKAAERNLPLSVMSFFPHPRTVLDRGDKEFHYLMPQSEKETRLRKLGVDTFYTVEFDKEFASLLPEQFVADYLIGLKVVHAVAGFDYSYGRRGAGNLDTLKTDSGGLISITKVDKVEIEGEKVSSTLIRKKLLEGEVEELANLLGSPYKVKGTWEENRLIPHPYYTLPAPGTYYVSLKSENGCIGTEMEVTGKRMLQCNLKTPSFINGSCSVVWHYRLPKAAPLFVRYGT
ncbi:FAD synthetase family protein [Mesobacillus campisalis]|uniref:FAD synthetase family protein n=1 Tax=Mesobacillus campisalis TaxID=1408103 RepID=UPI00069BE33D|nr:FAD synthetase family protein [Mesobacillus campisalis]